MEFARPFSPRRLLAIFLLALWLAACTSNVRTGGSREDTSPLADPTPSANNPFGLLFPHLRTAAYILNGSGDNGANDDDRRWAATHFDLISGGVNSVAAWNVMKGANPRLQMLIYVPYNTVLEEAKNFMEAWAAANGKDKEELYYHYLCNTNIRSRSSQCLTLDTAQPCLDSTPSANRRYLPVFKQTRGSGDGAACSPGPFAAGSDLWLIDADGRGSLHPMNLSDPAPECQDASRRRCPTDVRDGAVGAGSAAYRATTRVPSAWLYGAYPNVCPSCPTFVAAFTEYAKQIATLDKAAGKFYSGMEFDTFDGTVDGYYNLHLELTAEMATLGMTAPDQARAQAKNDLLRTKIAIEKSLADYTGNPAFSIFPNCGDVSYLYYWVADLYKQNFQKHYDHFLVEYLITTAFDTFERITYLKQLYADMQNGMVFMLGNQSNETSGIPEAYQRLVLANHYLINHPNGYFAYHRGSAINYGCGSGSCEATHWLKNTAYDIGAPAPNGTTDCWGQSGSDKMFLYSGDGIRTAPIQACEQQGGGVTYTVLARRYTKALVLAYYGNQAGLANIGSNPKAIKLDASYRPLQPDNTLGTAVDEISLGRGEGAILIKEQ